MFWGCVVLISLVVDVAGFLVGFDVGLGQVCFVVGWFLGSSSTVVLMFVWVYVVVFRGVLYCGVLARFVAFSVWVVGCRLRVCLCLAVRDGMT